MNKRAVTAADRDGTRLKSVKSLPNITTRPKTVSGSPERKFDMLSVPSFHSVYAQLEEDDDEPGPGKYVLPGSIGVQVQSQRENAPTVSLAGRNEHSWSRVYISKAHRAAMTGKDTPGAGTYRPKLQKTEKGLIRFGSAERFNTLHSSDTPGPEYDVRGDPASQSNTPFPKASRFLSLSGGVSVGPGHYDTASSSFIGSKAQSFSGALESWKKVALPGFDRQYLGTESPGPGAPFNLTCDKFSRKVSFAKSERMPNNYGDNPGPGAYSWTEAVDFAKLKSANSNFKNPSSTKFGTPSARSRLDFRKLASFQNSTWGLN
eukprot:GDKJ01060986.1.p1 GENE.GDKJ01060986.1~~GDKJ01060986.1.p1  ORF type:complete len:330 (+),score=42.73 GDKJ01060986.1:38-991(+)